MYSLGEKKTVDISAGYVTDGWFETPQSHYHTNIAQYKRLCRSKDGYPKYQEECDKAYEDLKKEAEKVGVEFVVERIILGDNPTAGAMKAMASVASGLD
jgi:hypothetical protein